MKFKKTTLITIILVIVAIGVSGLALYIKKTTPITPHDIVRGMISATSYTTDVTYVVKNARGQFKEDGKIEYISGENTKITVSDKEQIFMEDKIVIKYFKDNKIFNVSKDFDSFYKYMFINELPKFLEYENNVSYSWETIGGRECLMIEYLLLSGNDNFYKEVFVIDKKNKVPLNAVIYDNKGNERITVEYKNFIKAKSNKKIFD